MSGVNAYKNEGNMKIAIDIDDTLSIVDRVGRAGAYIARKELPFKLVNEHANSLLGTFDWTLPDVIEFMRNGGIATFTEAEARRGAREVLTGLRAAGHEVVILTSRTKELYINPEKISRDWLEKRRIPYDEIVAEISDKGRYCVEHDIPILVDDTLDFCLRAQALGVNAVLAIRECNRARASEIRYGGETWQQIGVVLARLLVRLSAGQNT